MHSPLQVCRSSRSKHSGLSLPLPFKSPPSPWPTRSHQPSFRVPWCGFSGTGSWVFTHAGLCATDSTSTARASGLRPVLVYRRHTLSVSAPPCVETEPPGHRLDRPGGGSQWMPMGRMRLTGTACVVRECGCAGIACGTFLITGSLIGRTQGGPPSGLPDEPAHGVLVRTSVPDPRHAARGTRAGQAPGARDPFVAMSAHAVISPNASAHPSPDRDGHTAGRTPSSPHDRGTGA